MISSSLKPPSAFPNLRNSKPRRQGGFALVLVFLLVSLLAVIVFSFVYSTRVNLRLARNRAADLQMTQLVKAGLEAAKAILEKDGRTNQHDWLGDSWAEPLPPLMVEGALLHLSITDEDRKINVNGLAVPESAWLEDQEKAEHAREGVKERILRAVGALELSIDSAKFVHDLAKEIVQEEELRPLAEEPAGDSSPYMGRPFLSIDQLLQLEQVNSKILYGDPSETRSPKPGLADVLTTLNSGSININTAPLEVLLALSQSMTSEMAESIIERRKEAEGLQASNALSSIPGLPETVIAEIQPLITTKSTVFSLVVQAEKGPARRKVRAILQRPYASETPAPPGLIVGLGSLKLLRWEEVR